MSTHTQENKLLVIPAKAIRARVIADYCRDAGYRGVVCFSCGNASRELKKLVYTVDISDIGELRPGAWWTAAQIHKCWPDLLDATSGHLAVELMLLISQAFRDYLGELEDIDIRMPTGSGETILCLKMAYPDKTFIPVRNIDRPTMYEPKAPLNRLCRILFKEESIK